MKNMRGLRKGQPRALWGQVGRYRYYDMDDVLGLALADAAKESRIYLLSRLFYENQGGAGRQGAAARDGAVCRNRRCCAALDAFIYYM